MITESEFVMIKGFDTTLQQSTDAGQRIINAKNSQLISHSKRIRAQATYIANLEAALAAEKAKNASLMAQIRGFLQRH